MESAGHNLPRTCRIRRRPEFICCYESGRRYFSQHFILFTFLREDAGWRVGCAVSKKMGSAVRRNKIKRLLREFFRLHSGMLPDGIDIVAVPKRTLTDASLRLGYITQELTPVLHRIAQLAHVQGNPA